MRTACQLWCDAYGNIDIRLCGTTGEAHKAAAPSENILGDGRWHLITASYNRRGRMQLYLDGLSLGSAVYVPALEFVAWQFPVVIGANNDRGTVADFLVGALDDLRIYNYALSQGEIGDLYREVYPDGRLCILEYTDQFDLNGDCVVDFEDFAILASSWLSSGIYPGG
jgi:hypothetical protein